MRSVHLRVKLIPLPREREKAYHAALRALAEIIREEIYRQFSQTHTHSLDPSPDPTGEGWELGKEAVACASSTS